MQRQNKKSLWRTITIFGFFIFLAFSILFIIIGKINTDESWYLYASKLVFNGKLPYQDFAFTQMPLLPYIYGIPQKLFFPSLFLGRITSVILSISAFTLSLLIAYRYGGEKASAITSLSLATFTYGIYFQSITKTYALTTFFFVLAFFILSYDFRKDLKFTFVTMAVLLAVLTRLSALLFAIPFIIYAFIFSNTKTKLIIIALCVLATYWIFSLALPNIEAAKWGLLTHHVLQWGNLSVTGKIAHIINTRIPLFGVWLPGYILLWGSIIFFGYKPIKTYLKSNIPIFVAVIGLLLFAIPNISSGAFYIEYFVPCLFLLFPIMGIFYVKIINRQKYLSKIILQTLFVVSVILGLIRGGVYFIDISSGLLPIKEVQQIAEIVAEKSTLNDKVYTLQALSVAVEANREVMPNMALAQFSFYKVDTKTANRLHLINDQITLNYIKNRIPKVVILTTLDWDILRNTNNFNHIVMALEKNYKLILTQENFGQSEDRIEVYIR